MCLFRTVNPLVAFQELVIYVLLYLFIYCWLFVLQKDYCASDTLTCIEEIDSRFFREIENYFVLRKYIPTHCVRTVHISKRFNIGIVIPAVSDESATLRNCSQLFHTCLHCIIRSCLGGKFCSGWDWQFCKNNLNAV